MMPMCAEGRAYTAWNTALAAAPSASAPTLRCEAPSLGSNSLAVIRLRCCVEASA